MFQDYIGLLITVVNMASFRETFEASEQFESFVQQILSLSGKPSLNGTFPIYTRKEAEDMVRGWINSFESLDILTKKGS